MNNCRNCDAQLGAGVRFCQYCGSSVDELSAQSIEETGQIEPEVQQPLPEEVPQPVAQPAQQLQPEEVPQPFAQPAQQPQPEEIPPPFAQPTQQPPPGYSPPPPGYQQPPPGYSPPSPMQPPPGFYQQPGYVHQNVVQWEQEGQTQMKGSAIHWIPLIICLVAFFVFGVLGGDPDIDEVNFFDFVACFLSIGALVSTFFLIPKKRKLYVVSLIITIIFTLVTLSYVLSLLL